MVAAREGHSSVSSSHILCILPIVLCIQVHCPCAYTHPSSPMQDLDMWVTLCVWFCVARCASYGACFIYLSATLRSKCVPFTFKITTLGASSYPNFMFSICRLVSQMERLLMPREWTRVYKTGLLPFPIQFAMCCSIIALL